MTVDNQEEIDGILRVGAIVARVRDAMLAAVKPGMTTLELDQIGGELLAKHGAVSAPKLAYDFPGFTCISINEEAAHGIPGPRIICPKDVVNVDVSAELDGFFADTGATMVVPPVSPNKARLCHATKTALTQAIAAAKSDAPMNQIGKAVQSVARQYRFKVIKNLAGHGLGRSLHEEPKQILGYYNEKDTRQFKAGQVVAIEPFLSTKSVFVEESEDGWSLVGHPSNLSAQFEHTIIITEGKPIIATLSPGEQV